MMPVSPILLVLLLVFIQFGFLARPLQRLGLSERAGMLMVAAMLVGSLVEITVTPRLTINLGTGVLPLLLGGYLLIGVQRWWEPVVALGGAVTGAGSLALLSLYFPTGEPTELNLFFLDAQYFYALIAGVMGYLVGHTRRASFAGAVAGALAGDLYHFFNYIPGPLNQDLVFRLSGGGFHGTALVAGIIALTLADMLSAVPAERGRVAPDHLSQS